MDSVFIKELQVPIKIGCFAEERSAHQVLLLNVEIGISSKESSISKDINDTVCYKVTAEKIKALASENEWILLEEFGEKVCNLIFSSFRVAQTVTLEINKFIIPSVKSVGVKIQRGR